nr:immunoglobulin light chain junction region [Macaca mulatta]MOX72349.1 immunoglobulin light chain junction region [Macaca mulatta]
DHHCKISHDSINGYLF